MSILMKTLKADLPALAELIRSQGRGRDTVLAHITPKEAALLKKRGGSGTINPDTGLPEFQEDFGFDYGGGDYGGNVSGYDIDYGAPLPEPQAEVPYTEPVAGGYSGETYAPFQYAAPGDEIVTPEQASARAAALPELYPGGQLPPEGYGTVYTPTGQAAYAPSADLAAYAAAPPTPVSPGAVTPPGRDRTLMEKLGLTGKDITQGLLAGGLTAGQLARMGAGTAIAGGLTAQNVAQTRRAQEQAAQAKQEIKNIGKPYQESGAQLTGAAQRGELTPSSQQALQAAQAQMAQGVATRGGVGAAQMQTQIAGLRNLLLENQYNLGLRVAQIGDNYAMGAIKTGLEADRAIGAANQQFYGQLAQLLAPFITGVPTRA